MGGALQMHATRAAECGAGTARELTGIATGRTSWKESTTVALPLYVRAWGVA